MSVLVVATPHHLKLNKSSLEAVSYGSALASSLGVPCIALATGPIEGDGGLGRAGASRVWVAAALNGADSQQLTRAIVQTAERAAAQVIIFSHDLNGKLTAPRVAAKLGAGIVPGAVALPDTTSGFVVKKNVFSGKAVADVEITTDKKVITVLPNSFGVKSEGSTAAVEEYNAEAGDARVKILETRTASSEGGVSLPEAEIVVSAGRGMKGPEHWGPVEELAKILGAATACSRPVADIGWRPHHEHVGQTGLTIRPNLYIAVGISGAIQHLAGVNGSKVIVVINKDPEAPFFKAADYGIVGDAFEVLPKIVEAARHFKAAH